jgi:hypothetical protein
MLLARHDALVVIRPLVENGKHDAKKQEERERELAGILIKFCEDHTGLFSPSRKNYYEWRQDFGRFLERVSGCAKDHNSESVAQLVVPCWVSSDQPNEGEGSSWPTLLDRLEVLMRLFDALHLIVKPVLLLADVRWLQQAGSTHDSLECQVSSSHLSGWMDWVDSELVKRRACCVQANQLTQYWTFEVNTMERHWEGEAFLSILRKWRKRCASLNIQHNPSYPLQAAFYECVMTDPLFSTTCVFASNDEYIHPACLSICWR